MRKRRRKGHSRWNKVSKPVRLRPLVRRTQHRPHPLHTLDDPAEDEEIAGDPYKTLFVGRLPFACTEDDLRREFEIYGPLERVRVVTDKEGKSRGYAFIIYEREKDMKGLSSLPFVLHVSLTSMRYFSGV